MKICLISRYFDLTNGGIGRVSMELRKKIEEEGHEVVCVSDPNRYNGVGYMKYCYWDLVKLIPKDCNVYHCLSPMEGIFTPKDKTVTTIHDLIPWTHTKGLQTHYAGRGIRGAISRMIAKMCYITAVKIAVKSKYVVTDSEFVANELSEVTGRKRDSIRTIRLGIREDLEPTNGHRNDIFTVGTLSSYDTRRKRADLLISEFQKANIPNSQLLMGGKGIEDSRMKQEVEGDSRIKFLGFIPDDKLVEFYNRLDVFVFPTQVEGYGLPIVEAMACNKPVVVMEDGIIPDDVKNRCIISRDLANTLRIESKFYKHEDRGNYEFAKQHSWKKCADEYMKLYQEIVEN